MNSYYDKEELGQLGLRNCGEDVKISRKASIYGAENISIGDHVRIDDFCILSGNIVLGNYIHIAAACVLFGGKSGIQIMDFCGISSRSAVYAESDDYLGDYLTNPTVPDRFRNVSGAKVTLKKHVIIGSGTCILPDVTIGEGASVGCMSLVDKTLEAWGVYAGCPCRKLKERSRNLLKLEKEFMEWQ